MEGKKCAMCRQVKKLCESHIIPKFFGNYIKKNSPSGGLRNPNNVNKREQDIYKENLLCDECEEIFSKLETYFQNNIFSIGLKKARKASQFSKRSSKELRYLQRAPFGVFFFILSY